LNIQTLFTGIFLKKLLTEGNSYHNLSELFAHSFWHHEISDHTLWNYSSIQLLKFAALTCREQTEISVRKFRIKEIRRMGGLSIGELDTEWVSVVRIGERIKFKLWVLAHNIYVPDAQSGVKTFNVLTTAHLVL